MDMDSSSYHVPTALTVLAAIFLLTGAICAIIVTADIVWRQGWRSMMLIMIPVWIINATYMGPITLYLYFRFGRAASVPKSSQKKSAPSCHQEPKSDQSQTTTPSHEHSSDLSPPPPAAAHCAHHPHNQAPALDHSSTTNISQDVEKQHTAPPTTTPHCHASSSSSSSPRPMWATVASGVSHCGAGCVLGDLVGEWLVYGTSASIAHESLWPELLIDYAFALLFGIVFQYFSIAPMSQAYGPRTLWRAAKADILSLTSFEVGAFGWMVAYQAGIWGYGLDMTQWTYWWMMQVGMAIGFVTAFPVNWWLIRRGVKEPCC